MGVTVLGIQHRSLSARRAWIEIRKRDTPSHNPKVALRKESVDRNDYDYDLHIVLRGSLSARRAWIEIYIIKITEIWGASLSARRAWIEMPKQLNRPPPLTVALRKESVDRNLYYQDNKITPAASLSARRAWIEICQAE